MDLNVAIYQCKVNENFKLLQVRIKHTTVALTVARLCPVPRRPLIYFPPYGGIQREGFQSTESRWLMMLIFKNTIIGTIISTTSNNQKLIFLKSKKKINISYLYKVWLIILLHKIGCSFNSYIARSLAQITQHLHS